MELGCRIVENVETQLLGEFVQQVTRGRGKLNDTEQLMRSSSIIAWKIHLLPYRPNSNSKNLELFQKDNEFLF